MSGDLDYLRGRLAAATGPLDPETACRLHALGKGVFVEFVGRHCGDAGEDEFTYRTSGSTWVTHHVSEFDLPDRNLDAAMALAEFALPPIKGFAPGSPSSSGWKINLYRGMTPTGEPHASWECCIRPHAGAEKWHNAPTPAIAVLMALVDALSPSPSAAPGRPVA